MKTENKSKKKLFIIGGAIVGGLAILTTGIIITVLFLTSDKQKNDSDDDLNANKLAELYEKLSKTHAHFSSDSLISIPKEELDFTPVDGIDYSSKEISNAFDDLYASTDSAVKVITNNNAVYSDNDTPPQVTKSTDSANPNAPKPAVYAGGVDIRGEGRGDLFGAEAVAQSDMWEGMGDVIEEYIDPWSDPGDSDILGEWNDADFWKQFSDYIIYSIQDDLIDSETLADIIRNALIEHAKAEWRDDISWDGMGDVIDDYVIDEWSDPGDATDPGLDWDDDDVYDPGYDMEEISYRTMGRLFYREVLSTRQQKAYDVIATAIQRGNFNIGYYDFNITNDEAKAVIDAVVWDNPEFSFIRGHSYGPYDAETITVLEILLDDDIMKIGIDKTLREIATIASPVISSAEKLDTDIEKVKYIVDHLCSVNVYSSNPSECKYSQSMYSAIVTNEAICAGYASAFHYYMNALNIDATRLSSCAHLWNLVQLDGEYYYMDVTWVDTPVLKFIDGKEVLVDSSYEWFNFNEKQTNAFMKKTQSTVHQRDYISVLLPTANGTKYSYENWFGKDEGKSNNSSDTNKSNDSRNQTNDSSSEPVHSVPVQTTQEPSTSKPPTSNPQVDEEPTIVINGIDVSSEFDVIEIDDVYYAQSEPFIESIRSSDMPESMRYYNYDFTQDDDEISSYLDYWFDPDGGNFLDDSHLYLLESDAIIVNSWFTDSIICMFFVDSPYAFVFSDDYTLTKWTLDEVPKIVDGEVYIPIEEFSDVMQLELKISS